MKTIFIITIIGRNIRSVCLFFKRGYYLIFRYYLFFFNLWRYLNRRLVEYGYQTLGYILILQMFFNTADGLMIFQKVNFQFLKFFLDPILILNIFIFVEHNRIIVFIFSFLWFFEFISLKFLWFYTFSWMYIIKKV